mmetsp:Transcript_11092/g.18598  ORF Transcript_11092/g.18598 Transcript_11092/m.18598 type:complete len:97 (-) Transcript_11092:44-334(-)
MDDQSDSDLKRAFISNEKKAQRAETAEETQDRETKRAATLDRGNQGSLGEGPNPSASGFDMAHHKKLSALIQVDDPIDESAELVSDQKLKRKKKKK